MEAFLNFVNEQKTLLIVIGVAIVLLILVSIFGKVKSKKDEEKQETVDAKAEDAKDAELTAEDKEEAVVEERVVEEPATEEAVAEESVVEEPAVENAQQEEKVEDVKEEVVEEKAPVKKTSKKSKKAVKEEAVAEEKAEVVSTDSSVTEEAVAEEKVEEANEEKVEELAEDTASEVAADEEKHLPGTVEVYKGKTDFYFSFRASNNILIGRSQGYTTKDACKRGVKAVMTAAEVADIRDSVKADDEKTYKPAFGTSVFEIYADKEGKFRWRLYAKNQQNILASKGYASKAGAKRAVQSLKKIAANYVLEDLTKQPK